jgi:hypothetical protein
VRDPPQSGARAVSRVIGPIYETGSRITDSVVAGHQFSAPRNLHDLCLSVTPAERVYSLAGV